MQRRVVDADEGLELAVANPSVDVHATFDATRLRGVRHGSVGREPRATRHALRQPLALPGMAACLVAAP
jgi:hypothetical protein